MNRCNFGRFDSNLSLCTWLQQKEVEVQLHIFLSMELDEIDWQTSGSSCFIPRESGLNTHWIQDDWGLQPGWTLQRPEKSLQLQLRACTNLQVLQFGALSHQCCYLTVRSHITLRISRLFLWSFVSTIYSMQFDCIPIKLSPSIYMEV